MAAGYYQRALVYRQSNDAAHALADFDAAIEHDKSNARYWNAHPTKL